MEIAMIIVFLSISLSLFVVAGANLKERLHISVFCVLFGAGLLVASVVQAKLMFGTLYDHTLDHKIFVVKARAADDASGKKVFVLFDLQEKKNRLAEFKTYPPVGYKETETADRGLLLSPIPYPRTSL